MVKEKRFDPVWGSLPKTDKTARKILGALRQYPDGVTEEDLRRVTNSRAKTFGAKLEVIQRHGLGKVIGEEKDSLTGEVYKVWQPIDITPKKKEEKKAAKKVDYWPEDKLEIRDCPACGERVVNVPAMDSYSLCHPKRRIVVFVDDIESLNLEEMLKLVEESTGQYVIGRPANKKEIAYYRKHGTLDGLVPWTIGRALHLAKCPRWDLWLSGEAEAKLAEELEAEVEHEIQ